MDLEQAKQALKGIHQLNHSFEPLTEPEQVKGNIWRVYVRYYATSQKTLNSYFEQCGGKLLAFGLELATNRMRVEWI